MKNILIILFLLLVLVLQSQEETNIEDLKQKLENTNEDSTKVRLLKELADEYGYLNPDKAIATVKEALQISKKNSFSNYITILYNRLGNLYASISDNETSESYFTKSLEYEKKTGDESGVARSLMNIGTSKQNIGQYSKSLDCFFEALNVFEKNNNELEAVYCYINIGITFSIQNNYDKALEYFLKGLKHAKELNNPRVLGHIYLNLGAFYDAQGEMDKALEYYTKQLELFKNTNEHGSIANAYNNIGCIYEDKEEYEKSIEYYTKSAELHKQLQDKFGIALCYGNIAGVLLKQGKHEESEDFFIKCLDLRIEVNDIVGLGDSYHRLGNLYYVTNKTQKALEYFKKAFSIRDTIDIYKDKTNTAEMLSLVYSKLGDYKNAFEYQVLFKQYSDSLFNENNIKKITELQMQYDFDQEREQKELEKQKTAIKHKAEIEKLEIIHKNQNRIIYLFIFIILIVIIFLFIVFRQYKHKKRANILLAEQNEEIKQQKEEIIAQRDEIETQRDLAANQRDIIKEQNQEMTDSIEYAKRIQRSTLPHTELLSKHLSDHFILFKPRDIVSGDFYWFAEIEKHLIITAADCTGHGVPGAFMSMLGISILKEIVLKEYVTHPGVILRKLRKEIIEDLHQKGDSGEQQDGMDMALISINLETKRMHFAGANNPIYLIRNGELVEYKGDKMPIAIYQKMDKFSTHEIQLQKDDIIYLFSDGYADQFGGEKGKKFKYKPFKQLLLENKDTPMAELKVMLDTKFEKWKGNLEQVDDIILMGLKI